MSYNHRSISYFYLNTFLNTFQKNGIYVWPSSTFNAQHLFFYLQKFNNFEKIIFYARFQDDLNFLNQEAEELFLELGGDFQDIFGALTTDTQIEIVNNFKKHRIANWDFDRIVLSSAIACCVYQLEFTDRPDVYFFEGVYYLLLNNKYNFQFYYFLKTNNILLKHREKALITLQIYLDHLAFSNNFNMNEFFQNFILIWDLFEFSNEEYLMLKSQVSCQSEIRYISPVLAKKRYSK